MSHRIATFQSLAPRQVRSIDPFEKFDSDKVNTITRFVTNGKDIIIDGLNLEVTNDKKTILVKPGLAVKDDCLIQINDYLTPDGYAIKLDPNNSEDWINCKPYENRDYYVDTTVIPHILRTYDVYVVLYYSYYKNLKANRSYIGFITKEKYLNEDFQNDCIVLGIVTLSYVDKISKVVDNSNIRLKHSTIESKNVYYDCKDPCYWNNDQYTPNNLQDTLTRLMFLAKKKQ